MIYIDEVVLLSELNKSGGIAITDDENFSDIQSTSESLLAQMLGLDEVEESYLETRERLLNELVENSHRKGAE